MIMMLLVLLDIFLINIAQGSHRVSLGRRRTPLLLILLSITSALLLSNHTCQSAAAASFLHSDTKTTLTFHKKNARYLRSHQNNDETLLIPEQNPSATPHRRSSSKDIPFGQVHQWLESLYPKQLLQERNAQSRTDGYWPYLQRGQDPPKAYTYGEFDFYSFANLLEMAIPYVDSVDSLVFTDIGSGAGRLVLAASALHPWSTCRGIEILPGLCAVAEQIREQECTTKGLNVTTTASIEFICGSFTDPYVYFGDSDVIFCFSTCLDEPIRQQLAMAIGRQCRPGTIVITTDYMLPSKGEIPPEEFDDRVPSGTYQMECLEQVDTWCWLLGGPSKAYIHNVTASLYQDGLFPLSPPVLSLEDRALQVVRDYENGKLTDTEAFLRNVDNNVIFYGLPERFLTRKNRRSPT